MPSVCLTVICNSHLNVFLVGLWMCLNSSNSVSCEEVTTCFLRAMRMLCANLHVYVVCRYNRIYRFLSYRSAAESPFFCFGKRPKRLVSSTSFCSDLVYAAGREALDFEDLVAFFLATIEVQE